VAGVAVALVTAGLGGDAAGVAGPDGTWIQWRRITTISRGPGTGVVAGAAGAASAGTSATSPGPPSDPAPVARAIPATMPKAAAELTPAVKIRDEAAA
jgi:hypothetical protein